MIVDWHTYYDVAQKCRQLAEELRAADKPVHKGIKELYGGMAGSSPGCKEWGCDYDESAKDVLQTCSSLANALTNYAAALCAQGHNWAVSNKSEAPPPDITRVPEYRVDFPTSLGDNGIGYTEAGGNTDFLTHLKFSIGQTFGKLPNSDTDKLDQASTTWEKFSTDVTIDSASSKISELSSRFDLMDDIENRQKIQRHFKTLQDGADAVRSGSREMAAITRCYHDAIRSFGKGTAKHVNNQGASVGVTAGKGKGIARFDVGTTSIMETDRIDQGVAATLQGIQDAFQGSSLSHILGIWSLSADSKGTPDDFHKVQTLQLESLLQRLNSIIAIRPVLYDEDATNGKEKRSAGPTNGQQVRAMVLARTDKGLNKPHRQIATEAEMIALYNDLTREGTPSSLPNYYGEVKQLADGTKIGLRDDSLSGGRTIDIHYPGKKKPVKVHLP